jgi:hypothetical protein
MRGARDEESGVGQIGGTGVCKLQVARIIRDPESRRVNGVFRLDADWETDGATPDTAQSLGMHDGTLSKARIHTCSTGTRGGLPVSGAIAEQDGKEILVHRRAIEGVVTDLSRLATASTV